MAQNKSYQEVLNLAKAYFKTYPNAVECLACTDGNIFHADKASLARTHAKDAGCATHTITRSQAFPKPEQEGQEGDDTGGGKEPGPKKQAIKKAPAKKPPTATPEDRSPDDDE